MGDRNHILNLKSNKMARQVVSQNDLLKIRSLDQVPDDQSAVVSQNDPDDYIDRLLKYIPTEIVAVFILVQGFVMKLDHASDPFKPILWGVFLLFAVLTPLYLWRILKVKKIIQLVISLVAFVVWVFALGGPFTTLGWYDPLYGQILLPIFTIVIALVVVEK